MIIPHSAYCTNRMAPLQVLFHRSKGAGWVQTYGIRPAKLFLGADQRLAIYIIRHSAKPTPTLFGSRYNRWHEQARSHLFAVMEHADVAQVSFQNSVPKFHNEIEQNLWEKLAQFLPLGTYLERRRDSHTIYFHNSPRYWVRAMNFIPYFWNERDGERKSTSVKSLSLATELDAAAVVALLNSSLFYWWFIILSDCRVVSVREIRSFPIGITEMDTAIKQRLSELSVELMQDLKNHAQRKECYYKTTGLVIYDEFFPRYSKPIIDKIDQVLAQHYGFTNEELDFIVNYDIKYRMGLGK